jgi:hypothetical protein
VSTPSAYDKWKLATPYVYDEPRCEGCEGHGSVTDRHPHDPDARDLECEDCGGTGRGPVVEEDEGPEPYDAGPGADFDDGDE